MFQESTILIVDDDEMLCTFVEDALSSKGWNTYTAPNIQEAKRIVRKEPIVRVQGEIFPGVFLAFHSFKRIINDKMHRKMFYLEKGDIRDTVTTGANPTPTDVK